MNDDPTQVNVLFAKVHDMSDNKCFQSIVDHLFDKFEESGLMCRSHEYNKVNANCKVKLHVTLMNSSYKIESFQRKSKGRDNRDKDKARNQCFDASIILNKYKDYFFGEINVESIEISIRYSNLGKNGYYSHTSRIDL